MTTFAESNILSETRQEYDSKVDLLCEWADAYYAKDQPVVPDSVYDQLFREIGRASCRERVLRLV